MCAQSTPIKSVILVVPTSTLHRCKAWPPTHVIQLGSYAQERAGVEVRILDVLMDIGYPMGFCGEVKLLGRILAGLSEMSGSNPREVLVGFSLTSSSDLLASLPMMKAVSQELGMPIVVGGYAATLHAQTLAMFDFVDHVVCGPGEEALVQLLRGPIGGGGLPKVIDHRKTGHNRQPSPKCLDFTLLQNPKAYDRVFLYTSLGCPFTCHFCPEHMMRPRVTYLDTDRIRRDIEGVRSHMSHRVSVLGMADPLWGQDTDLACNVLDIAKECGYTISFETRADAIDDRLWPLMKDRVEHIIFGFETASPTVLRRMNKCSDTSSYLSSMKASALNAWKASVVPRINLIINYPGANYADHCATVDYIDMLRDLHDEVGGCGFILNISWYHHLGTEAIEKGSAESCTWEDALPCEYHGFRFPQSLARVCTASSRDMGADRAMEVAESLAKLVTFQSTTANEVFSRYVQSNEETMWRQAKGQLPEGAILDVQGELARGGQRTREVVLRSEALARVAFPSRPARVPSLLPGASLQTRPS